LGINKTILSICMVYLFFLIGCGTTRTPATTPISDPSTKKVTSREQAYLSCLQDAEEDTSDPFKVVEATRKCMRDKGYTLKGSILSREYTDSKGCPLDTDCDGVPDYGDDCPGTPKGVIVDARGCPPDRDGDGVPDYRDECPGTRRGVKVDSKGCPRMPKNLFVLLPDPDGKVGEVVVKSKKGSQVLNRARQFTGMDNPDELPWSPKILDENQVKTFFGKAIGAQPEPPIRFILYFKMGTTALTAGSTKIIPDIIMAIKSRKSNDIRIAGHTDRVASESFNRKLSFNRANRITEIFVSKGVNRNSIKISFHGESNPLIKTADGVPEPKNRRVEVNVR